DGEQRAPAAGPARGGQHVGRAAGRPAPFVQVGAHQHLPDVRVDAADPVDPPPDEVEPGQRGLGEVVGGVPVAAEQVCGAAQRHPAPLDVGGEVPLPVLHAGYTERPGCGVPAMSVRKWPPSRWILPSRPYAESRAAASVSPIATTSTTRPPADTTAPSSRRRVPACSTPGRSAPVSTSPLRGWAG